MRPTRHRSGPQRGHRAAADASGGRGSDRAAGLLRCLDPSHGPGRRGAGPPRPTNIRAFLAEAEVRGLDAVVVNTSGCGTTVKGLWPPLFADRSGRTGCPGCVAGPRRDRGGPIAGSARRGRGRCGARPAGGLSRRLFAAARPEIKSLPRICCGRQGLAWWSLVDSHLCCGSAGTYNLLQPAISAELRTRKVQTLMARAPQVIAAGNIGCMLQIRAGRGSAGCAHRGTFGLGHRGACPPRDFGDSRAGHVP